ncbi:MAG: F0F1 ATP synthase subunit epsilon, partial [Candidatus Magasanikbacteria bacterium]|nr:F0F1 ATP synthase subunit epsilon [Candidatus Magasanikbacteria bacterium]
PGGTDTKFLAVSQGFVEVRPHGDVVVLANTAEVAGEIDIDRAEAARARAKELLSGKIASEEEYATVAAAIEKEFARVKIGRKHATHHRTSIGE